MDKTTIYELPLNERVRTLLRLEFLFNQARYTLRGYSIWDSRATITHLIDIMNIVSRLDIRSELLKEVERHLNALKGLRQIPGVDVARLDEIVSSLQQHSSNLKGLTAVLKPELADNEFLSMIRQRLTIPGGTCDFDLPAYHHWLTRPAEERIETLQNWLNSFNEVRLSLELVLNLLRDSADTQSKTADDGFFQQTLDTNTPFQLIRVILPENTPYYAELSGGKHRFSVRFMMASTDGRPTPYKEAVPFKLACCAL